MKKKSKKKSKKTPKKTQHEKALELIRLAQKLSIEKRKILAWQELIGMEKILFTKGEVK